MLSSMLSWMLLVMLPGGARAGMVDVTAGVGLDVPEAEGRAARIAAVDLDGDGWSDLVLNAEQVFLNRPDAASPIGRRFAPVAGAGLEVAERDTLRVFVDIDQDGLPDAVSTSPGRVTFQEGIGGGRFGAVVEVASPAGPVRAIAAGDMDRDGHIDLLLAEGYLPDGDGYEGAPDQLLLPRGDMSAEVEILTLVEPGIDFEPDADPGGRPSYGAMFVPDDDSQGPAILGLSYGRRWNRWWRLGDGGWTDHAPALGIDGDDIRHGAYPDWLAKRARTDPRFDRDDEAPFRANGNTFDAAVGDLDNDGRPDLCISTIRHAWAGESSDPSRLLFAGDAGFETREGWELTRAHPEPESWNEGDLFCELADLDQDGRLDVILSSGDYPDDQRLRIWRQVDGGLSEVTAEWGVDHDGSQQIALADFDRDGDLDLIAGQTFNRYGAEQREGREPHLVLLANDVAEGGSLVLSLIGEAAHRHALGATVVAEVGERLIRRDLIGVGGHAGKQQAFTVHLGLGDAEVIDALTVTWPDAEGTSQRFEAVSPGRYTLRQGGALTPPGVPEPERTAALLSEYLRIDTQEPRGPDSFVEVDGEPEWMAFLMDTWVTPLGLRHERLGENLAVFIPSEDTRPPILWLSHADVVTVDDRDLDDWTHPPFAGVIEDGVVYGRGALDNKSSTVMQLEAVRAMLESGGAPSRDVVLVITPDEEIGGAGAQAIIAEHLDALGNPTEVLDEGGFILPDFYPGLTVATVAVGEKTYVTVELRVKGEGGHASMPREGNPTDVLVTALARVADWETERILTPVMQESLRRIGDRESGFTGYALRHPRLFKPVMLGTLGATAAGNAVSRDTVAITILDAGVKDNVIPGEAVATLNARLLPDRPVEGFLESLEAVIADERVEVRLVNEPVMARVSRYETSTFAAIQAVLEAEVPDVVVLPTLNPGTQDSRFFAAAGLDCYRFIPVSADAAARSTIHGNDELVAVEELGRGVRVYKALLESL